MERLIYQAILTPEEEGGYSVYFPDLEGCATCGDDYIDAVDMAADAAKTYIAALIKFGDVIPRPSVNEVPEGSIDVWVSFEADPSWIIDGPVVSAAQAARDLGVSRGRISQMLSSGILEGYHEGRRTWVSLASINRRLAETPKVGRPKKECSIA